MNRELIQLRKKTAQIESGGGANGGGGGGSGGVMMVGGSSSNCGNKSTTINGIKKDDTQSPQTSDTDSQLDGQLNVDVMPTIQIQEPSKKTLIERIVRLQQASARQNEKIDFLENHSGNLSQDLQKKTKLVQYYMLRDQTGALSSSKSDRNKVR